MKNKQTKIVLNTNTKQKRPNIVPYFQKKYQKNQRLQQKKEQGHPTQTRIRYQRKLQK